MRIFITGGTGFIGQHVVKRFQEHDLLILSHLKSTDSENIKIINGSLNNIHQWRDTVEKFKPDATLHLAWEGIPDYGEENSQRNLNYGLNLYQFLSDINCKTIITTGSCWEYGGQEGKLSENTPAKPLNPFTEAKNSLRIRGQKMFENKKINFIWTRLFYIYGPGQRKESLIHYLINCAKDGKTPEIKNPNAENDFVYVEDVADALYQILLKCKENNVFNIGSGKLTSVSYIIDKIFSLLNVSLGYQKGEAKHTDSLSSFYADLINIKKVIGWKPKIGIDEGIQKTIHSIV